MVISKLNNIYKLSSRFCEEKSLSFKGMSQEPPQQSQSIPVIGQFSGGFNMESMYNFKQKESSVKVLCNYMSV